MKWAYNLIDSPLLADIYDVPVAGYNDKALSPVAAADDEGSEGDNIECIAFWCAGQRPRARSWPSRSKTRMRA
jgi:hypothetical protein